MSRPLLRLTLSAATLAAGAGAVGAQTSCGPSYEIRPGDTLYRVSQRCEVGLTRIMSLNPNVDPRSLSVGQEIRLTAGSSGTGDAGSDGTTTRGSYRVSEGDTLYSIAQAAGVTLFELLNENEDVNPAALAIGELLDIPGSGDTSAAIDISPQSGPPGSDIALDARNLRPNDFVTIGVGRVASEWRAVDTAQVAEDGDLSTRVWVPDWADPGARLIFVVDTDRGITLKSDRFSVVEPRNENPERERITLEGRVGSGAECAILTTSDGDVWSLTSGERSFTPGERVRISGQTVESSFCQQGVGTVEVASLTEIDGGDQDRDGERMTLEGRVRQGVECMVLETRDGDIWSLTSDDVRFTAGEYVEVSGQRADMSFCQQGVGTLSVASIEEVSPG
ncbi:DUF5818 domain-containing protein [Cribrihabitans sp. XS_ASV171]